MSVCIFWFRRDLRLKDNTALLQALHSGKPVLPIFIFDSNILKELPEDDSRVTFIHETLFSIHTQLKDKGSGVKILHGDPIEVFKNITEHYDVSELYFNRDNEPYARERDRTVYELLKRKGITLKAFKDQTIFERNDILKSDGTPYTVYTPYKNRWLQNYIPEDFQPDLTDIPFEKFVQENETFPSLQSLGFKPSPVKVKPYKLENLKTYHIYRDFPAEDNTSYLSPHLRFGTISIREIIQKAVQQNQVFLSELIWREFFMQILFHFPNVVEGNFKKQYDGIIWRNNEDEFEKWCQGKTGYPLVDAGMRELNQTGYMHNRVRMITASFLCKHLLIDWRWGESYFAKKLLDYELASNNGNWQWAAGTGCDAAPYFRVFNPTIQQQKFDKDFKYIKKWVPEFGTAEYSQPMVEHKMARERAISTYKEGIQR